MRAKLRAVSLMYFVDLACLGFLLVSHIASFWSITLLGYQGLILLIGSEPIVFIASYHHQASRLYFWRYGENYPFFSRDLSADQGIRKALLTVDCFWRFRSASPISMPLAPIWLVELARILLIGWLPYFVLQILLSVIRPPDQALMLARLGSVWLSFLLVYCLPILHSWRQGIILDLKSR